jgi:catechol 2,3-dioxygenase-like lactoylglutathione lyase family enzyme
METVAMRANIGVTFLAVTLLAAAAPASAQLAAEGPVTNGHYHLNVSDVVAHERFWGDTLGGVAGTFGAGTPIYKFPDALVFLREQNPEGSTIGSTVDHVGFSVPDLRAMVDRLVAAGYEMITTEVSPPGAEIVDDIRILGRGPVSGIAFVAGPDDVKVEVLERREQSVPIASDHVHFFGTENEQMRAWYVEHFGASLRAGPQPGFVAADLPALALNFTGTESSMAGTAGRVLDHIGFEVADLEALVAELEAKGIEFDVPYREIPEIGLALAFLTDPWGTYIELTEGLDEIR